MLFKRRSRAGAARGPVVETNPGISGPRLAPPPGYRPATKGPLSAPPMTITHSKPTPESSDLHKDAWGDAWDNAPHKTFSKFTNGQVLNVRNILERNAVPGHPITEHHVSQLLEQMHAPIGGEKDWYKND